MITTSGVRPSSTDDFGSDPYLSLYSGTGALLAWDEDGGTGLNSRIEFSASSSATVYLEARSEDSSTGSYLLSATGIGGTGPTPGDDFLIDAVNTSFDQIYGLEGNDTIAGATNDALFGGEGNDILIAYTYADIPLPVDMKIAGGFGFDVFYIAGPVDNNLVVDLTAGTATATAEGRTVSVALAGIEGVYGTAGNDSFRGSAADNYFSLGPGGNDTVSGGAGRDVVAVESTVDDYWREKGISADLGAGILSNGPATSRLTGIEGVAGTAFSDSLYGGAGDDFFGPGIGEDLVVGRLGNDRVDYDSLYDIYLSFDGLRLESTLLTGVSVNLTLGRARKPDGSIDVLVSIESVLGSFGNDTLYGSAAADTLMGGAGQDRIAGNDGPDKLMGYHDGVLAYGHPADGSDTLTGGAGNDSLFGGQGNDSLSGGVGDDQLRGEAGQDTLSGGPGVDRFYFAGTDGDVVSDFQPGVDRLMLYSPAFAGIGGTGALPTDAFAIGTVAGDSSDRLIFDPGTGRLLYDPDGTGSTGAVLLARITLASGSLSAGDFELFS